MSYSSLTDKYIPAYTGNYSKGRQRPIRKVTIHHVAGVVHIESLGALWQRPGRNGSSNYGVGVNGRIGCYVQEEDTSWCDSNWDSNSESITIETSNSSTGGNWNVSDASLNSLINLIVDIFRRYGLKAVKGKTITWHRMYAATACPGPYLLSKMDYIVSEVNKRLGDEESNMSTPKIGDKVIINGPLYTNANATTANGYANNKTTYITRYMAGYKHPYNTTGDMGWMDASSIRVVDPPKPKPKPEPPKDDSKDKLVLELQNKINSLSKDIEDLKLDKIKLEDKIKEIEEDNKNKDTIILDEENKINSLESEIKELNKYKFKYNVEKTANYEIELNEKEVLYIK